MAPPCVPPAPIAADMRAQPLSLTDQLRYTDGGNDTVFARAVQDLLGGDLVQLWSQDARHKALNDWPEDEPLSVIVVVRVNEDCYVSAEGADTQAGLARGFGFKEGWKYTLEPFEDRHAVEGRSLLEHRGRVHWLRQLGWEAGAPRATHALAKGHALPRARAALGKESVNQHIDWLEQQAAAAVAETLNETLAKGAAARPTRRM
jgi:hypothetical protein